MYHKSRNPCAIHLALIVFVAMIIIIPLLPTSPVFAQGTSYDFNFATSAHGWTAVACPASCYGQTNPPYNDVPAGSYTGGSGWQSATASDGYHGGGVWIVNGHIDYTFTTSQSIDQIDVYYTANNLNGICGGQLAVATDNVNINSGAPSNGSHTVSYTSFGESGTSHIHIKYDSCEASSNSSGSILITRIIINSAGSPFGTPDPSLAVPPKNCAMLGPNNSSFLDPNDWTFLGATYYETAPNSALRLGSNTYATLENLNLNPTDTYSWEVIYQGLGTSNGTFTVQIGSLPYQIDAAQNTDQQVYDHPSVKIPADDSTGKYTVTISRPPGSSNDMVIRFFCITKDVGNGGPVVSGGTTSDECAICDPPLGFTDIIGILNWIVCNIRRLFTCYLLPALAGWLAFLVLLVRYFVSFVQWIVTGVSNGVEFLGSFITSRVNFGKALIENVPKYLSNSAHVSGIAATGNIVASDMRDLPTTLLNALETFGGDLSAIFTSSQNLLELVLRLIWLVVQSIVIILGLIPLAITSLISGLQSSGGPISGSPVCSDTSSPLYAPCLGFYVLDNTIFAGPAGYLLPVLVLVFIFENITWALNSIREALSK